MKKINILWTGGWDSTYRILRLIDKPIEIQPYYLKDNRASEEIEINTIRTIINDLEEMSETRCKFLEPKFKFVSEIPPDENITQSYKNLYTKDFFGSQYDWLSRFAKNIKNLELTVHRDDTAYTVINNNGEIKLVEDEIYGKYYILNKEKSSEDLINIFGNFHFPLLDTTKLKMKKWAEENNLIHIMNKTWFCHHPINGKPCGKCNPCKYTIEEGLTYRFDEVALKRYQRRKKKEFIRNSFIYKGLKKIYKKLKGV